MTRHPEPVRAEPPRLGLLEAIARIFQRADDDLSRDPARVSRAQLTRGFPSYVEKEAVKSVGRKLHALRLDQRD